MSLLCLYPGHYSEAKTEGPAYPWTQAFVEMERRFRARSVVISISEVRSILNKLRYILFFIPEHYLIEIALTIKATSLSKRGDVILAWYGSGAMLGIAKLFWLRRGTCLIVLMYRPFRSGGRFRQIASHFLKAAFRGADGFICINEKQRGHIAASLETTKDMVRFVRMGIDTTFFRPMELPSDGYILCPGDQDRDEQLVIKIAQQVSCKVIRVTRRKSVYSQCIDLARAQSNISVLYDVPFMALRSLYARSRLVILPLLDVDHPAGMTARLEAMAMAKPVIISDGMSAEGCSLAENGVAVIKGNTPQKWFDCLGRMLASRGECEHLGKLARKWVERYATIESNTDGLWMEVSAILERSGLASASKG